MPRLWCKADHNNGLPRIHPMSEITDLWRCTMVNCGYMYDPSRGDRKAKIPKGVKFEDLPADWHCPVCGATKKSFEQMGKDNI